jgi:hypothetical protein
MPNCTNEIRLCCQKMDMNLGSIGNKIGWAYVVNWKEDYLYFEPLDFLHLTFNYEMTIFVIRNN